MSQIAMKDISVEFPGVKALQHVGCDFEGGRVKALVGANGAGQEHPDESALRRQLELHRPDHL